METFHGTTILSVRRDGAVALGGDGQVTLGNVVIKATARKVRRLYNDRVLAGFAGATADAFTLFERFEAKLDKHQGHLTRAAVELAKDWRSDRVLRRLEAMLAVADRAASLVDHRHGRRARARARHRRDRLRRPLRAGGGARAARAHGTFGRATSSSRALTIAGDLCIYTNQNHVIETLDKRHERHANAPIATCSSPAPGLVGLALAPALARAGLTVALVDRAPRRCAGDAGDRRRLGCARLRDQPGQRVVPARARRVAGAAGRAHRADRDDARRRRCAARCSNSRAYELGERALAWIVEERALRAALVPLVACGRRHRARAAHARVARLVRGRGDARGSPTAPRVTRAPRRRRRRPALVGARGGRHRRRAEALRADGGRRQFRLRARASRSRAASGSATTAAFSRGCRCPGAACRSSGRRPTRWRRSCSRSTPDALARARRGRRARTRSARSTCITPAARRSRCRS